jgi:hypothetical protein
MSLTCVVTSSIGVQQRPGQLCSQLELEEVCAVDRRIGHALTNQVSKKMPGLHACFAATAFFAAKVDVFLYQATDPENHGRL